ncbi:MAG: hypothetical protein IKB78_08155 [Clostridia bacterium]|nr:hypothetical protein [Clostridia bacterium]
MTDWITTDDLMEVYRRLKERYPVMLTNASAVDDGFTVDCPILTMEAHGRTLWLYEYGGDFVLDVMNAGKSDGKHWHPADVDEAVENIEAFAGCFARGE